MQFYYCPYAFHPNSRYLFLKNLVFLNIYRVPLGENLATFLVHVAQERYYKVMSGFGHFGTNLGPHKPMKFHNL